MTSQLSAKYQFGAIHTLTQRILDVNRALLYAIIIIMTGMALFYVAGYLIEERRRWPLITASPRGQCSK